VCWEGFWLDAFDYEQLHSQLLDPLQPGGSGRYRSAVHALATDQRLDLPYEQAPPGAILLLDGVFLHRDELVDSWDLSIVLEVPFGISVARMAARDGTDSSPDAASVQRYVQAQRHYLTTSSPHTRASLVIDNSDLERPVLLV
jgi:uridine kinase